MKYLLTFLLVYPFTLSGQQILSPSEFLGYPLGERFTRHHRVVDYFEYIAEKSDMVVLEQYGETYENRPLLLASVSTAANIQQKEAIRLSNLSRAGLEESSVSHDVAIVWLSYNVHGNESVSTEASMQTLYELVNPENRDTKQWLERTLVLIDPCINPDGRDRYVNWYNQVAHRHPNILPEDLEHREPWPRGRANHYLFDLNRDWAWQTQQETQYRIKRYNEWMPQIHVDFHEQGVNSPYYFAPAAEPYHELITDWQREFQDQIGRNHARYFDKEGWRYFTKEVFDLLYPSYGDTYPTFNGAIGMTYEQGGSGRAGRAIQTETGDTLSLKDRIAHHHTTGLSTIEVTATNADQVLSQFKRYFDSNQSNPPGTYKTFVVKSTNGSDKLKDLKAYLDRQQIEYGTTNSSRTYRGFSYGQNQSTSFNAQPGDLVISSYQPKSVLAQVLFDPDPKISDSLTYDITGWALPYQYDLEAYATTENISIAAFTGPENSTVPQTSENSAYAYLLAWDSFHDAKVLAALLQKGLKVRYAERPFTIEGRAYGSGTLVITKVDNEDLADFDEVLANYNLQPVSTGWAESGYDLGSRYYRFLKAPKIAVLREDNVSSYSFGEIWHYFERQLEYPFTTVGSDFISSPALADYSVLILPNGRYRLSEAQLKSLSSWIREGGNLIMIQNALSGVAGKEGFALKKDTVEQEERSAPSTYAQRNREAVSDNIPGAIFQVSVDSSHPLGFGLKGNYFSLKTDDLTFPSLQQGWNVATIAQPSALISGFAGFKFVKKQQQVLALGVEQQGRGSVVYMVDNPLFRAFWYQGKLLMANSLFFVGQ